MPALARLDEAPDELTVDELRAPDRRHPEHSARMPLATAGVQRFRVPLWAEFVYFASSPRRPSRLHAAEQNLWFTETATKSRQQQSQWRAPKLRVTPNRSLVGRCARHLAQMRWFPWLA